MSKQNLPKSAPIKAGKQPTLTYTLPAAPKHLGLEPRLCELVGQQPPLEQCRRIHADNMALLSFILLGSGSYADYMRVDDLMADHPAVTDEQRRMIRALGDHFTLMVTEGFSVAFILECLRHEGWLAKMPGHEGEAA
ncbi:MAG: hypothetical protein PHU14_05655 [Methylovulum sp.]|nr:hypothetical protein [Methylovulum sp.]